MREVDIRVIDVKRREIPSSSQRSFPSIGYILYKSISIGSKFTKIIFFQIFFFSFYFNNILVVLFPIWHVFAIIRSFFFILLLLLLSMLRLQPANTMHQALWPADYLVLSGALGKPCTRVIYSQIVLTIVCLSCILPYHVLVIQLIRLLVLYIYSQAR